MTLRERIADAQPKLAVPAEALPEWRRRSLERAAKYGRWVAVKEIKPQ